MLTLIPEAIERYVHDHTSPRGELFDRLRETTYGTLDDPQMQVGRVEGTLLKLLVQLTGARRVLEIGTFSGYSGLAMASGLPADGRLITCDVDPKATAVARQFFDASPWGEKIEIKLGPASETIEALARDGATFDLVFIDADKGGYIDYYEACLPLLPPGGVILADNTLWSGRVLAPESASDRAIVAFNRHVAADPRVEQVLLSVRDGLMMIRKLDS